MDKHYEFVVDMETGTVLGTKLRFVRVAWIEPSVMEEILDSADTAIGYALDHGAEIVMPEVTS